MPPISRRSGRFRVLVGTVVCLCGGLSSAQAQRSDGEQAELRARMAEFLHAVPDQRSSESTRRFFPTSGVLRYTRTVHDSAGGVRRERWIIPAAEISRLFGYAETVSTNPVNESLEINYEAQKAGLLLDVITSTSPDWRLVGRSRYVPSGAPSSSSTYVEWRREGRQWVIGAFGDEWYKTVDVFPAWYR